MDSTLLKYTTNLYQRSIPLLKTLYSQVFKDSVIYSEFETSHTFQEVIEKCNELKKYLQKIKKLFYMAIK